MSYFCLRGAFLPTGPRGRRSAALDCCQIAAGRAEIFFECRLSPWDYAAGTLIAQEAGATATRLEGGPMDPLHAGSVFITNGVCHSVLSELQQ